MKSKFKPGDLVVLSAAGSRMQQNSDFRGGFGFIETIDEWEMKNPDQGDVWPIKTKWWTKDMKILNGNFKPYELKFFKNK